jgi:hypothetical protein
MDGSLRRAVLDLSAAGALALAAPAAAHAGTWTAVAKPAAAHNGHAVAIKASHLRTFTLDAAAMRGTLAKAPKLALNARALATSAGQVVTLPAPDGKLERFSLQDSPVMASELAALHPDIHTYAGRGIDDPTATIRADQTPLGFHASVRSDTGNWYIDPYFHGDTSVYASYYGRDLTNTHGAWVESDVPEGSDPLGLGLKKAAAAAGTVTLRTYRLALSSDQTYATYFGAANVTAAKVTLMNRVDQLYEDELAIRMILIGANDKLNFNTDAQAILPHGPCGAQACWTPDELSGCGAGTPDTLSRNRVVIGQLIGAANYDIGHIVVGQDGGGVAALGVVGGNNKAQGCTGIPTPQGDFFAVDYVAHEMGHEFGGNHTFNGTVLNCGGGNRNGGTSVEPGSGSSIMAYAGICRHDDLQPHSDPYFSQRSYDEITTYTSSTRAAISEVQNVGLDGFGGADGLTLSFGNSISQPFVHGVNYSGADLTGMLNHNEAQWDELTGYDAGGDSFTLNYGGVDTVPIVRGQNNTAAGIQNALQGGNETQTATLTGFDQTAQSFQISLNGNTSPAFGLGGTAISRNSLAAAISSLMGCAQSCATVANGAGNGGFNVTFNGTLANTDVPALAIVNCTGTCTASARTTAQGGKALSSWPAGGTVSAAPIPDAAFTAPSVSDAGFTLAFAGTPFAGQDVDLITITHPNGMSGTSRESTKGGGPSILPAGGIAAVAAFGGNGGTGVFDSSGFQVTFSGPQASPGTLANLDQPALGVNLAGGDGFTANVGETAKGGPIQNQGFFVTDTGNHAPLVTAPSAFTIPTRTPFSLTGSATDADGDPLTYMWEQNDTGATQNGSVGTPLTSNTKANGPLFRQFGTRAVVSPTDTLLSPSPGENAVDANPTRVFPDMAQIVADNTDAATGQCPADTFGATDPVPASIVDCYSEFLPTSAWVGVLGDRTMNFRLTARDYHPNGGGIGSAATKVTVAPLAGPFRVTSATIAPSVYALSPQTVTWDVAGTDQPPVSASQVKISLSTDGGMTYPYVLAAAVPNTGSARVVLPNVTAAAARFKVEAVGNVFFDISHRAFAIVPAPTTTVGGVVPATLSLSLGAPASFGTFTAGLGKDYDALSSATVTSTAGDAALAVSDPDTAKPGHLVNGAFSLPSALQAAANGGAPGAVSNTPLTVLTYNGPVSNNQAQLNFRQHIGQTDALRTGNYSKTLTFTLSTTTP